MKKSVMSSNERNEYLLSYGFTNEDITGMYKKSNVLTGLKKETIKFSEIADIADTLGYEIIFKDKNL